MDGQAANGWTDAGGRARPVMWPITKFA